MLMVRKRKMAHNINKQIHKEEKSRRRKESPKRETQGGELFLDTFVLCVDATQHWNALDQNTVLQGSAVTQECFGA